MGQLQLYMSEDEREAVRDIADALGIPVSQLLRTAVVEWVARCAAYIDGGIKVSEVPPTAGPIARRAPTAKAPLAPASDPAPSRRAP